MKKTTNLIDLVDRNPGFNDINIDHRVRINLEKNANSWILQLLPVSSPRWV